MEKNCFESIIGYRAIKLEVSRILDQLTNPDKYSALGVTEPHGLILHGMPGVGKSTFANAVVEASERTVFVCRKDKSNGDFVNEIVHIFDKACAFTGHRTLERDFSINHLKKEVEGLIVEKGVTIFYVGMAMGFDLCAAEIVLKLKKKYDVKLVACIPHYYQEKYFSEKDKKRYVKILKACDEQIYISQEYYKGCLLKRNRYMCDRSNYLIAYLRKDEGGTAYTVNYFKNNKQGEIIYL